MRTKKLEPKKTVKEKTAETNKNITPIVGIGASAGGLEALEQFLSNVPENSGMAFIVIQHMDPTHKGMLPELLQRISKMKVCQVKDRTSVKPNCVYVIPPNKSMSILKGVLHLFEPIEIRGLRLPIDHFFRSLADDQKENAVGVILSGMGSDGCIGIRALKEKNGIVMVQEPSTAKFDSMPRNAIDSTLVDIVAPPNELPTKLIDFLKLIPVVKSELDFESKDRSSLEKIIILLRTQTGNDFSLYKKNTLYRRIERRMGIHKIEKITSYVRFLRENPKEVDILFKELLIGVTNFFRDTPVWEKLKEKIIPDIISSQSNNSALRAWIVGCSTGEEAYSLAIVFKEALEKIKPHFSITLQIFATDLDMDAIEIARKGIFSSNISADVSPNRLKRYFIPLEDAYQIKTEIREMVVFAQHNVIMHPPFSKIDILSCRNLLIYMDNELQNKLLRLFYYCLNPEGAMMLGSAESPGQNNQLFTSVENKLKIYKRSVAEKKTEIFDFPSSFSRSKAINTDNQPPLKVTPNIEILTNQLLLEYFSPTGVLVNENGDIIYLSGHTGKYLEPPIGKANLNIFAMLREGLQSEFPIAFRNAITKRETVILNNIKVKANGGMHTFDLTIQWIDKPNPLFGTIMIIFTDVPKINELKTPVKKGKKPSQSTIPSELELELTKTREKLQITVEEMQTSQEELKSTNEELQSTNEELQSTNEELTSSKEEMQSLNEELQTVNAELQAKVDDYSHVNNDMKNLLNSTDIATLFLDKELNIRRFTDQTTKIFKLIKSDIGRPFTDLVSDLIFPELADDALEVLRTLVFIQKQIPTKDGRWFSIRIMPYRTLDDRIDGLVITFFNVSDIKQLDVELYEKKQMLQLILNSSQDIIIKLSNDYKILDFNPRAEMFFGKKREKVLHKNYFLLFVPAQFREKQENDLKKLLHKGLNGKIITQDISIGSNVTKVKWTINILFDNSKTPVGMIMIIKK